MAEDSEGVPIKIETNEPMMEVNKTPSIPDQITQGWVEQTLSAGKVEKDGKTMFFRPYLKPPKRGFG